MTDWIGDVFTSDTGWSHLETLVDVRDRMSGSPGEREAAEATRDALAAACGDAAFDEFGIQGWTRGDSAVETPDGDEDCIALPRSPNGDVAGEFVDLGYGLPSDFANADLEGKTVMVASDVPDWYERYLHRREKYYRAVESGAAAFVYRNHVEGQLPPTGSVGTSEQPLGGIPAVGVSREVGSRLGRTCDGETVGVSVTAEVGDATSQNVHATLGPDTDEELLVTSHVDAHDVAEGAMDNGAGTAMVVELAHALADREAELDARVRFVCFGAEEVGLVGAGYDAANRDLEDVRAVLNLDGVVAGRTLEFYTHRFDALGDAARSVADRFDHPISVTPKMGPHSDHWAFVQRGVPGYHVSSRTDGEGRGWGHTHADTLDKLEARTFREQAILLTELAVELADEGFAVAHASEADVAAALEDENLAEGMKVTGDWPY